MIKYLISYSSMFFFHVPSMHDSLVKFYDLDLLFFFCFCAGHRFIAALSHTVSNLIATLNHCNACLSHTNYCWAGGEGAEWMLNAAWFIVLCCLLTVHNMFLIHIENVWLI